MSIESLYQDLLGRGVDQSGAATYAGWSEDQIRNAIVNSPEYAQRQQSSQPSYSAPSGGGGGGSDINSIYQNLLGRGVDQSGAATYAGWSPDQIRNAILQSPEYAQRQGGASPAQATFAGGNPEDLANQVFNLYRTNQNYDQALNQLNAAPQDADYYRARIALAGKQMGWQTGQNTGDRNSVYQRELESYLPGARAAGLSDAEINALVSQNAAQQSAVNQERIASDAKAPQGWVNQNIPGGWGTVAGLAALAAPYALPALGFGAGTGAGASGALTTTELLGGAGGAFVPAAGSGASFAIPAGAYGLAGSIGQALPYTEAFDAANLFANGITNPGQLTDILTATGLDPFLAADMGSLAAQGLSAEQIAQVMGYSYNAAELAGTGIQSFLPSAASSALSGSSLSNLLKSGSAAVNSLSKVLGGGGALAAGTNPYASALRGGTSGLGGNTTVVNPTALPNLLRANTNPYNFGQQTPVMTAQANKADPFASLRVEQLDPTKQYNPLAMLKDEGIYG